MRSCIRKFAPYFLLSISCLRGLSQTGFAQDSTKLFVIRVIDQNTGRGIPMVELTTSSNLHFYTDSRGIIAFDEPSLMNQDVYFGLFSHGYTYPEEGLILKTMPGKNTSVRMKRLNVAERLYRITGQDIYGHSVRIGLPSPISQQALNGKVTGQDTYIETLYKGKIYWFWGDTNGPSSFNGQASGATSLLPGKGGLDPATGIDLTYFTDATGFSKRMCPFGEQTLVWIQWLATLLDEKGNERLYALYKRINKDVKPGEAGFAVFNDSSESFERIKIINEWYGIDHRSTHPAQVSSGGTKYLYIINHDGMERVPAEISKMTDPSCYEHFTCLTPCTNGPAISKPDRDSAGRIVYGWKSHTAPFNRETQKKLVDSGRITNAEGLWQFRDISTGNTVFVTPASVFWNEYRKRWVMIAYEFVGGVWYFEGDTPTGPWVYGRKVVTHENYDFYNVGQHPVFDQDGGRLIYFEGTYTTGYSSNNVQTPLYDYNQMMYRLSLDDKRLSLPAPVYLVKNDRHRDAFFTRENIDSLHLWERISGIPFFAIPPSAGHDGLIPVYARESENGSLLSCTPGSSRKMKPLFFALPAEPVNLPDTLSGTWPGARSELPRDTTVNTSIVPLYEYRRKGTGKVFYSVDTIEESGSLTRSPKPICRVWRNPATVIALDYNAKPVQLNRKP